MKNELVTVVIPIHLEEPSELEKISLAQTLAVLHKHLITFMAPTGLNTAWYEDFCRGKASIRVAKFDWRGHEAFGELIVSPKFYEAFQDYQYMLICHLDAFVFRDELVQWCQQGYDYVGSVIYNPIWQLLNTNLRKMAGFGCPEYFGNGGFALKKISTFHRVTTKYRFYINAYHWVRKLRKKAFLDDLFISQHFPKLSRSFQIPPLAVAQQFGVAYEGGKEADLPFSSQEINSLPFGMHGWIQYQQEYWKPVIRHYGYQI